MTSAAGNTGVNELRDYLTGKVAVFAGPSGVGKSSLLNAMFPGYNAEVGELSQKIGRGKNTTRHIQLFKTPAGGYIADTPGFTSLDFERFDLMSFEELKNSFPEMAEYMPSCRFRKCGHTKEIGCGVVSAVEAGLIPKSRHESYVKLFEILKNKDKYKYKPIDGQMSSDYGKAVNEMFIGYYNMANFITLTGMTSAIGGIFLAYTGHYKRAVMAVLWRVSAICLTAGWRVTPDGRTERPPCSVSR